MTVIFDSVAGITPPNWTSTNRPTNPAPGQMGFNTTNQVLEFYTGSAWTTMGNVSIGNSYQVESLVVAGGGGSGGGNSYSSGGGGGGGVVYTIGTPVIIGTSYAVVVGAGGSAGPAAFPYEATQGGNSSFNWINAIGGGAGCQGHGGVQVRGGNGGSGGGGGAYSYSTALVSPGGLPTAGQGFRGGDGYYIGTGGGPPHPMTAGGGGGAGAPGDSYRGAPAANSWSGNGGNGILNAISGTATYYAGGGGGGAPSGTYSANPGIGGLGGGGTGVQNASSGTPGTANTGGGASGTAQASSAFSGGTGGSGIVIIRYAGTQRATGGVVTQLGGFTVHTFLTSGTFVA